MLTEDNFRANLATAGRLVARELSVDPANLTFDQRVRYNSALAAKILQFPASFSPEMLEVARRFTEQRPTDALLDPSLDVGRFVDEALDNARDLNPLDSRNIGQTVAVASVIAVIVLVFVSARLRANIFGK